MRAEPVPGPYGGSGDGSAHGPGRGPDAVVDLVLDLVPGEEAGGPSLGSAAASVSVPAVSATSARTTASGGMSAEGRGSALDGVPAGGRGASADGVPGADPAVSGGPLAAHRGFVRDERTAEGPGPLSGGEPAPGPGAAAQVAPAQAASAAAADAAVTAPAPAPDLVAAPAPAAAVSASAPAAAVAASAPVGSRAAAVSAPAAPSAPSAPFAAAVPRAAAAPAPAGPRGRSAADSPAPSRHRSAAGRAAEGAERAVGSPGAGRRQMVIGREGPATVPVHLLFRDDLERADGPGFPDAGARRGPGIGGAAPGTRGRPPAPRPAQVRPPTRPAPDGDPELTERSGPALPGWLALFVGLAGIAGIVAVLWWAGALPVAALDRLGVAARPYHGIGLAVWASLTGLGTLVLLALGGLSRGRVGCAWVLTLFGKYRGSVRRTGLMWISPLLLRRRVDVRLRHWRSEPLPAVDADGTALRVVVLVVWRVKDTARAVLGIADHETYLREQVEAAMARVLSQLPADAFHEDAPTLRDAETVGDALTRMLKADCAPVGIEVYSAQPTGIEYAPEIAAAMQRRRIAAIDAKHRDSVLTSVVDAVDDTVNRLTQRGIVDLDDYERKLLVKDLTVAFYTGRSGGEGV
ncbi:SPFH domain-containing protein [Streptomyces sp. PTD5-9]|uniref:SPFH domain-containing protein n=1 Tax=Streptomyces sp. PTD5-9 TaxID=3120150 RepID=UPI00300B200F